MTATLTNETAALIISDFGLDETRTQFTEHELLDYVADLVAYMMEKKLEQLFNTLYRMDVDEKKLKHAIDPSQHEEPVNLAVAKLIIEREKKRLITKKDFSSKNLRDWGDYNEEDL